MTSVGPLLVWGRSQYAGMSLDRRLSVLRSVMSSVRSLGTRVEVSVLISASVMAMPALVSGAR